MSKKIGNGIQAFPHFVNYNEGIYVGYRYYETASDEGLIDYDSTVQYPFGYGLSYTSFDQRMGDVRYDTKSGKVSFDVTVTNTGDKAGKDVVEVYYNPPYTNVSRKDHFANAKAALAGPTDYSMSDKDKSTFYNTGNYDPTKFDKTSDKMPTTGAKNGVRLAELRGADYDDAKWDKLLDELTFDDMDNLIANAGYQNAAIKSIGKVRLSDVDGPAALKDNFTGVRRPDVRNRRTADCASKTTGCVIRAHGRAEDWFNQTSSEISHAVQRWEIA